MIQSPHFTYIFFSNLLHRVHRFIYAWDNLVKFFLALCFIQFRLVTDSFEVDLLRVQLLSLQLDFLEFLFYVDNNFNELFLLWLFRWTFLWKNVIVPINSILCCFDFLQTFIVSWLNCLYILFSFFQKTTISLECPHEKHWCEVKRVVMIFFESLGDLASLQVHLYHSLKDFLIQLFCLLQLITHFLIFVLLLPGLLNCLSS
jgi:hypothetical protein